MPNVYIKKDLYDRIVRHGKEPRTFLHKLAKEKLRELEDDGGGSR